METILRKHILKRDRHQCLKCHTKTALDVHHVRSRCYGGIDAHENLATLCKSCHQEWHNVYPLFSNIATLEDVKWVFNHWLLIPPASLIVASILIEKTIGKKTWKGIYLSRFLAELRNILAEVANFHSCID